MRKGPLKLKRHVTDKDSGKLHSGFDAKQVVRSTRACAGFVRPVVCAATGRGAVGGTGGEDLEEVGEDRDRAGVAQRELPVRIRRQSRASRFRTSGLVRTERRALSRCLRWARTYVRARHSLACTHCMRAICIVLHRACSFE